jgi:glycerol uptake facilitator-like aquaporin
MFKEYIAEAIGSFVFFSIILTKNEPIFIAVGFLIGILIASIASQAHLNPAITTMAYMNGDMTGEVSVGYVASQLVGAIMAVQWVRLMGKKDVLDKPL